MGCDSKALLAHSKALADRAGETYDKAMLSTSERMAEKLKQALRAKGMSQSAFAAACGATKQAVQSWVKTGRIDKKHLPKFVEVLEYPLEWWLSEDTNPPDVPAQAKSHTRLPTSPAFGAIATGAAKAPTCEQSTPSYGGGNWPFATISQPDYAHLTDRQKGMVEGYIKGLLSEVLPSKRNGTSGA